MRKHSFIYTETKRTVRRTYGGSNYTLNVYDTTKGEPVLVGTVSACTAGHNGEASEAWSVILEKRPDILKLLQRRAKASGDEYLVRQTTTERGYHCWQFRDLGVTLTEV